MCQAVYDIDVSHIVTECTTRLFHKYQNACLYVKAMTGYKVIYISQRQSKGFIVAIISKQVSVPSIISLLSCENNQMLSRFVYLLNKWRAIYDQEMSLEDVNLHFILEQYLGG
jgi:hypothetical protein